jgi:hypothetical protein
VSELEQAERIRAPVARTLTRAICVLVMSGTYL